MLLFVFVFIVCFLFWFEKEHSAKWGGGRSVGMCDVFQEKGV